MKRWRTDGSARRFVAAGLAFLVVAVAFTGPDVSRAESPSPVAAGFSKEKLERVGDYLRNEVATGKIPGAVLLIQQHGTSRLFRKFRRA